MGTSVLWVISHRTVVPNTADRSSAVQKVLSITDEWGGGGGYFHFYKGIYSLLLSNYTVEVVAVALVVNKFVATRF